MPRKPAPQLLTPLELELMKVLWRLGQGTVQQVQEALPGEPLAYTTVQTMLNVLEAKGKLERGKQQRAFVYRPKESRGQAITSTLKDLTDRLFNGSAEELVLGLLETKQLTPARLAKLQAKLAAQKEPKP